MAAAVSYLSIQGAGARLLMQSSIEAGRGTQMPALVGMMPPKLESQPCKGRTTLVAPSPQRFSNPQLRTDRFRMRSTNAPTMEGQGDDTSLQKVAVRVNDEDYVFTVNAPVATVLETLELLAGCKAVLVRSGDCFVPLVGEQVPAGNYIYHPRSGSVGEFDEEERRKIAEEIAKIKERLETLIYRRSRSFGRGRRDSP